MLSTVSRSSRSRSSSWSPSHGRSQTRGGRFGRTTISEMLRNATYAGLLEVDGETVPGEHEPLVTPELFNRVQATHRRTTTLSRHRVGLLSGLVRCSSCGGRMHAHRH